MDQTGTGSSWASILKKDELFWIDQRELSGVSDQLTVPTDQISHLQSGFSIEKLLPSRFQSSLLAFLIISEFPQTTIFGTEIVSMWYLSERRAASFFFSAAKFIQTL